MYAYTYICMWVKRTQGWKRINLQRERGGGGGGGGEGDGEGEGEGERDGGGGGEGGGGGGGGGGGRERGRGEGERERERVENLVGISRFLLEPFLGNVVPVSQFEFTVSNADPPSLLLLGGRTHNTIIMICTTFTIYMYMRISTNHNSLGCEHVHEQSRA